MKHRPEAGQKNAAFGLSALEVSIFMLLSIPREAMFFRRSGSIRYTAMSMTSQLDRQRRIWKERPGYVPQHHWFITM